jgi:phosphotransferase system HPr (HPr) family protein
MWWRKSHFATDKEGEIDPLPKGRDGVTPSPVSEQAISDPTQRRAPSDTAAPPGKELEREGQVIVAHADGLHARPAAMLVKLARSFACDVEIVCRDRTANAKSSVKIMLLGVKHGDEVTVRTRGADAADAFRRIADFLKSGEELAIVSAPPAGAR